MYKIIEGLIHRVDQQKSDCPYVNKVISHLLQDLNTAKALRELEKLMNLLNASLLKETTADKQFYQLISSFYLIISILGLKIVELSFFYDNDTKILIATWLKLKNSGRYQLADELRLQLQNKGVF